MGLYARGGLNLSDSGGIHSVPRSNVPEYNNMARATKVLVGDEVFAL
jgi:hypothetical protein